MLYSRLPGLNISALASLALVSPIVLNTSGPVGSGAPNRVREVQFVQITLQSLTKFPTGVLGWVAGYEYSDSVFNMDCVMHSSFHRQFFQVFTIAPRLYHWEHWLAGRCRHLLSFRALQDSEDVSYNGTESSGTSGRQLKLIEY